MRKRSDRIATAFQKGAPIDDAVRKAITDLKAAGEQFPCPGSQTGTSTKPRKPAR